MANFTRCSVHSRVQNVVVNAHSFAVIAVLHASFSLMPDGFFDENPTMHLATHHKPEQSSTQHNGDSCTATEQHYIRSKL